MKNSLKVKVALSLIAILVAGIFSRANDSSPSPESAFVVVVRKPGEFPLGPDTKLAVSFETLPFYPRHQLTYRLQHTNPDGEVLSTDTFNTRVDVGDPIVFCFDATNRVLWWGSAEHLVSVPWHALEKDRTINDPPATIMPTTCESSGWRKRDPHSSPFAIPDKFWKEVKKTFKD